MSSTQHQLIEQCATRLRGIVEALDNIHDTSPHRWSTDLDDVHSSAESLLALIKDQAPARSETSFEEWLANELEGEDGQPVPAAVCDIALARRAFNHWPKLEQPAKVGGVRFSAGVSSRLVVEAAQRLYEFESTPEQEAERIERLQAFREQLDPLNLAPHAKAFNEAPAEALRPEQAEAERPEVVAWSNWKVGTRSHIPFRTEEEAARSVNASEIAATQEGPYSVEPLMTVAQHERITAKLHDALDESDGDRWKMRSERDAANARLHEVATACATAEQERDAALAEVERLRQFERICEGLPQDAIDGGWTVQGIRGYAKRLEDQLKSALARVAELEKELAMACDAAAKGDAARQQCGGMEMEIQELRENAAKLAAFAQEIISGALEGGSFDGADLQESAERHGLIAKQMMREPCRGPEEYCACAWSTSFPTECYRITAELRALLNQDKENGDHAA
ncbi:TPA: hypothetical protein ACG0QE_005067 [Pseudomonas aeruginosa]